MGKFVLRPDESVGREAEGAVRTRDASNHGRRCVPCFLRIKGRGRRCGSGASHQGGGNEDYEGDEVGEVWRGCDFIAELCYACEYEVRPLLSDLHEPHKAEKI